MIRLCALLPAATPDETLAMAERLRLWGTGLQFPPGTSETEAAAVGRRFRDAGVRLIRVGDDQNLSTPVEAVREAAVRALRRTLALAVAAGALAACSGAGHCDPDRAAEPRAAHPGNFGDEALDRLARSCREILDGAGGASRLLLQTSALTSLDSLLRAAETVRRVASPAFGLVFDPVSLIHLDNYFDNGSFLRRGVQQLGAAIGIVVARDTLLHPEGFSYRLTEQPIGRGAIDHPALLEALAALPGDVPLCVERVSSEAEAAAALAHLAALLAS